MLKKLLLCIFSEDESKTESVPNEPESLSREAEIDLETIENDSISQASQSGDK